MAADVDIPDVIKCGYATAYLDMQYMWFSSGGSNSVIHHDELDNVNCVLSGRKRFFMVDPRHKIYVENEELGWRVSDTEDKSTGYGSFAGPPVLDPTDLNLNDFPRWKEVPWYDAQIEAGDCFFLPTAWYHQVS